MLSCGHSSLSLYIQLYLGGFGLELDDIKAYRFWGSLTPGHPEHAHTKGVEVTTGPLGQGVANAVGMAMAARRARGLLDPDAAPGSSVFDHHIYCLASDGDIEEGVSSEASSLAATQRLDNLTLIYDSNRISIEDDTNIALTEDTTARYAAYGWHVQTVDWTHGDAHHYQENVAALAGCHRRRESSHGSAELHLPEHDHRLAGTPPARHRQGAWRRTGCRGGCRHQEGAGLRSGQDLRKSPTR